jgi:hypothetical protein
MNTGNVTEQFAVGNPYMRAADANTSPNGAGLFDGNLIDLRLVIAAIGTDETDSVRDTIVRKAKLLFALAGFDQQRPPLWKKAR